MKAINALVMVILILASGTTLAELKDPMTRNEDLTHTTITVNVSVGIDGNYHYEYVVNNPATNLGRISDMWIDISCDLSIPNTLGYPAIKNYSEDGKHVPVYAETDTGFDPVVTATNMLSFAIFRSPGETKQGIRMISAQAPVLRKYILHPVLETEGWDYSAFPEDPEPDANGSLPYPWEDDFIVEGFIQAPACSLNQPPDDPTNPPDDNGCTKGKGKALGLEIGKGHEISQGKHLGHEHDCE